MKKEMKAMNKIHNLIGYSIVVLMITAMLTGVVAGSQWPVYGQNPGHTGFSSSTAPETNDVLWKIIFDGGIEYTPVIENNKIYFGVRNTDDDSENKFICMDIINQDELWEIDNFQTIGAPAVTNDMVLVAGKYLPDGDERLYCFDAVGESDGTTTEYWNYTVATVPTAMYWTPFSIDDDKVYAYDKYQTLVCLEVDPSDGTDEGYNDPSDVSYDILWRYEATEEFYTTPAVHNGLLFVSNDAYGESWVMCFDADPLDDSVDEGINDPPTSDKYDLIWTFRINVAYPSRCFVAFDDKVAAHFSWHGMYCWDADTSDGVDEGIPTDPAIEGENYDLLWFIPSADIYGNAQGVSYAYDRLYVNTDRTGLKCLDADTGERIWQYDIDGATPAIADMKLYTATTNDVHCIDPIGYTNETGVVLTDLIWNYNKTDFDYQVDHSNGPVIANGCVFVGTLGSGSSQEGELICFRYGENMPPEQPEIIDGETEGYVNTPYTFTLKDVIDPDGDDITYIIDWGDDTEQWLGGFPYDPYTSGEREITVTHTWNQYGVYTINITALDEQGNTSQSEPYTIDIGFLDISSISGGIGGVTVTIDNVKNDTLPGNFIDWNIDLVGGTVPGFHLNKHFSGREYVDAGGRIVFGSGPLFGLGRFKIMITAESASELVVEETIDGYILLFYVIV